MVHLVTADRHEYELDYDGDEPACWGTEDAEECAWQATRCGGGKATRWGGGSSRCDAIINSGEF